MYHLSVLSALRHSVNDSPNWVNNCQKLCTSLELKEKWNETDLNEFNLSKLICKVILFGDRDKLLYFLY